MENNIVLGILAHVDAGKTTLSEQLLFESGVIRKMGRVDHGNSFMDTDEMERERGITIFSKQAQLSFGDKHFTLLDTPGHVDFSAEMERSLQVLDYALLVVSVADGVQGHTETVWRLLEEYHIPTILFINKMDQPQADRNWILQQIRNHLSPECIDFSQPYKRDETFYESVAMSDEVLLEAYLESGKVEETDIVRVISERKVFPCFFGSALKKEGITQLIEGLVAYTKAPERFTDFGARIFKITRDIQGNRITHMKLTGGRLKTKEILVNATWEKEEKVNQIRTYNGDKFEVTGEAEAGDICAVTGLSYSVAGEGLGVEEGRISPHLLPVLTYKVFGPDGMDAHSLLVKLRILEEENPELQLSWDEELQEIRVHLMGDVQIEVLKHMVKERFDFEIELDEGDVLYQETICDKVEGVGHFEPLRHYAEVHLLLEPLKRGEGLIFETSCREDELSVNWQHLIRMHLQEKQHRGVLTGAPITDMKITLAAGKAHTKHTEGGDFRQATYRAVRQGLMQAQSLLLEPYYAFRIEIPSDIVGRVLSDMERMSASFKQPVIEGENAWINGRGPVSAMRNYAREIATYSGGRGRVILTPEGYDICHNTEEVLSKKQYDPLRDMANSPDSVFCEHGAGFIVPWSDVPEYMHLESVLKPKKDNTFDEYAAQRARREAEKRMQEADKRFGEEDKELKAIFEKTYGAPKPRTMSLARTITTNSEKHHEAVREWKKQHEKTEKKGNRAQTDYLLVDGYNIIFAWEELKELAKTNIDGARGKLMDILCDYQAVKKCRLILVFDAYKVKGNLGEIQKYHNIEVVYTKEAETADQYIAMAAHQIEKKDYRVTVATSDGLVQLIVWGQGCFLLSARELKAEVENVRQTIRENYLERRGEATNRMAAVLKNQSMPEKMEEEK